MLQISNRFGASGRPTWWLCIADKEYEIDKNATVETSSVEQGNYRRVGPMFLSERVIGLAGGLLEVVLRSQMRKLMGQSGR